jgi:tetratricopeptide (TPR) repeat protein
MRAALLVIGLLAPAGLYAAQTSEVDLRYGYESAQQAFRQGNLEQAQKLFEHVLGQSYWQLGRLYRMVDRFPEAVMDLEEAKRLSPHSPDLERELGLAYLGNQQYAAAAKHLKAAVGGGLGSAEMLAALGQAYAAQGDQTEARTYLERAVKADPADHLIAYQMATVLLAMKDIDGAARIFSELRRTVGDSAQFRLLVGRAYESAGYLQQGDAELRRALAFDPKIHYAHHLLGMSALKQGGFSRAEDAQRDFKEEILHHPDEFPPLFMLGVLMEMKRDWTQALTYLRRAQQLQPGDPDVQLVLGSVELSAGKTAQAIQDLQHAIDLSRVASSTDVDWRAHYLLSRAYRSLGDSKTADAEAEEAQRLSAEAFSLKSKELARENLLRRSLLKMAQAEQHISWQQLRPPAKENPGMISLEKMYRQVLANSHNKLGLIAARQNQFEKAVRQFEDVSRLDPNSPGADYNLGLAAYKAQRFPEAIAALKRAVSRNPEDMSSVTLLGLAEFQHQDLAEALPNLRKAVGAHPDDPGLLLALGTCLTHEGKSLEAQKIFDRLLRSNANLPEVHVLLGQAAYALGKVRQATAELHKALALDPRTPEAHYYLGVISLERGQWLAAEAEFRAEVETHPENAKARYNLGYVLLEEEKQKEAIPLLERLVRDVPGYAEAYYSLGKALVEEGQLQRGTVELETAVRLDPNKVFSHYQLGSAYLKAGRTLDAQHEFDVVRQLQKRNPAFRPF